MNSGGLAQRAIASQRQIMSASQIEAIKLLSLPQAEAASAVRREVDENPALEIVNKGRMAYSAVHTGEATKTGAEAAEKYQAAYENVAMKGETLQEHLLFQLDMMRLSETDAKIGAALIHNLDENGYHVLEPAALFRRGGGQRRGAVQRMIEVIQHMEPEGTGCNNMEESLLVQARIKAEDMTAEDRQSQGADLALYILDGHIDVLYSTSDKVNIEAILRKLQGMQKERRTLSFATREAIDDITLTEEGVSKAVQFISRLNPRPASGYGSENTMYATSDVKVKRENGRYRVEMAEGVPEVRLSAEFAKVKGREASAQRMKAKLFMANMQYREEIIMRHVNIIVERQREFFDSDGKAALVKLTQAEVAKVVGVAKSTTCRMAKDKYLLSPWGRLYPVGYFFTAGQEKAERAICEIVAGKDGRNLTDKEIAARLEERGIKIARRTVAKYRAAMEVASSLHR